MKKLVKLLVLAGFVFGATLSSHASVSDKAAVCAGYHTGYAIVANQFGSHNDRDHSVRVASQLDARYASSPGYTNLKNLTTNRLAEAIKTNNGAAVRMMIASCQEIGAPAVMNTGR